MSNIYRDEIIELHAFFQAWFRGDAHVGIERFADALEDGFRIVSPGGDAHDRRTIIDAVGRAHGQQTDIEIWTTNHDVRLEAGPMAIVLYEEWQRSDGQERGRLSTAVLECRDAGVRWHHVHETWLNPSTIRSS